MLLVPCPTYMMDDRVLLPTGMLHKYFPSWSNQIHRFLQASGAKVVKNNFDKSEDASSFYIRNHITKFI